MLHLQLLKELIFSSVGACLTNESVCEIMQTSFRICFEKNATELLRRTAEGVLSDMVSLLVLRLRGLTNSSPVAGDEIRTLLSRESMDVSGPHLGLSKSLRPTQFDCDSQFIDFLESLTDEPIESTEVVVVTDAAKEARLRLAFEIMLCTSNNIRVLVRPASRSRMGRRGH